MASHYTAGEFQFLNHRPHKWPVHVFNAVAATALFRVWPILLFMGGWSTMVILVNKYTDVVFNIPTTLITVLGVLLGLTLSYRTSSAYERYSDGRRNWTTIHLAARNWARTVWLHCPDTLSAQPPTDPEERALDMAKAIVEKKTVIQLALAFAVAVKHYLRGEEGILYEDLMYLVNYIPSLELPSGLPEEHTNNACGLPDRSARDRHHATRESSPGSPRKPQHAAFEVPLKPAMKSPSFSWSRLFPFAFAQKAAERRRVKRMQRSVDQFMSERAGAGHNIPLEITVQMSYWIATMQGRKVLDVPTTNALLTTLGSMCETLAQLERIVTTPIPWSYNAQIWEVSWIYCLALPFQLYEGFKWVTIPATVDDLVTCRNANASLTPQVTSYIAMGYASIAEEIENPFGSDKNDLNLDMFVQMIAQELDAITARPLVLSDEAIFTPMNRPFGPFDPGADKLAGSSVSELRSRLARLPHRAKMSPNTTRTATAVEDV